MATTWLSTNLYPPIVETYAPSFLRTSKCRLYFAISTYNTLSDIASAQVMVNHQNTNTSALATSLYPTGIKIAQVNLDTSIDGDYKYYIDIEASDLQAGSFGVNQYYKVQIRFTGTDATTPPENGKIAGWLTKNLTHFSEWSTIILVKGISQPILSLVDFKASNGAGMVFSNEVTQLVGNLQFEDSQEKETLKAYQVQVYLNATGELVSDSGVIEIEEYNSRSLNYTLKTALEDGRSYKLKVTYWTSGYYSETNEYLFSIIQGAYDSLNAIATATAEDDYGRIVLKVTSTDNVPYMGNITIRRSCSDTNFLIWEDIQNFAIAESSPINFKWYDYTAESGKWYKYAVQKRSTSGQRGTVIRSNEAILYLNDIFLGNQDLIFCIKLDPNISSFKHNIIESKTDTIGSKYAYFKRNGNVNYKSFPISGIISRWCDEDNEFTDPEGLLSTAEIDRYPDLIEQQNIAEYRDYLYEKAFRDKIVEFLYKNDVKLFRSITEGNILVKLMNISLTPNKTLGRMIYSFSADAYEIDECSIDNYNKYHIIDVGTYATVVENKFSKIGQYDGAVTANRDFIQNQMMNQYYTSVTNGYVIHPEDLSWLRVQFESDPYLIHCAEDGSLRKIDSTENYDESTIAYGHIMNVNGQQLLVLGSTYELKGNDVSVVSLSFVSNENVIIDYQINLHEVENPDLKSTNITYSTKVGQVISTHMGKENIIDNITNKHYVMIGNTYRRVISVDEITIEAEPGTYVYTRMYGRELQRSEIGSTGVLRIYEDYGTIQNLFISGKKLTEVNSKELAQNEGNYYITDITAESVSNISAPILNGVYNITGEVKSEDLFFTYDGQYNTDLNEIATSGQMIYYNGSWYHFKDGQVLCPIDAIVDYVFEMMEGEYQV